MALPEQADIASLPRRQGADVSARPQFPTINSARRSPNDDAAVATAPNNGPALSYQATALARLIADLLGKDPDTGAREGDGLAVPRLPGENANDTLRYLLRGLLRELRRFDGDRSGSALGALAAPRLERLHQFATGVVVALRGVPSSGAGDAVCALIGGFLDQAGLQSWDEFLSPQRAPQTKGAGGAASATEDDRPRVPAGSPADSAEKNFPAEAHVSEDPLEIPLMLVRPVHGDWARVLLKKGLAYLTKRCGEPAESLKPLLKTWLAQSGDDHKKVFKLIAEAQARNEPDPKGWVNCHLVKQAPA